MNAHSYKIQHSTCIVELGRLASRVFATFSRSVHALSQGWCPQYMLRTCWLSEGHLQRTCWGTPDSRRCTCVDVVRGARWSAPTRLYEGHTAVDRAPTLAARRTIRTASMTGIHGRRPAAFDLSGTSGSIQELCLRDRTRPPKSALEMLVTLVDRFMSITGTAGSITG